MKLTQIEMFKKIVAGLLKHLPNCDPVSVGGSVRDTMLDGEDFEQGFEAYRGDLDLEVFNAPVHLVVAVIGTTLGVELELVGRAFPVYKVKGYDIDISFPRKETATGQGHTDFTVEVDPCMSFKDAAKRRDITINAMGYSWKNKQLYDPYNGRYALQMMEIVPTSHKFIEDALRVLRVFKFIARYGFTASKATLHLCAAMVPMLKTYPKERLLAEWKNIILKADGRYIKEAFEFMLITGAADLFPELFQLKDVPQEPTHHPEGNCLIHSTHCFAEFCTIRGALADDYEKLVVGFAVLCHDMGKFSTTQTRDGKITAYGHEDTPLARQFMERLFDPADQIIKDVEVLVKAHMRPVNLFKTNGSLSSIRRLSVAVNGRVDRLLQVVYCDQCGRPGKETSLEAIKWVQDKLVESKTSLNNPLPKLILGRHLISVLGLKPSAEFGKILNEMFEAQLDGKFTTELEGIEYLKLNYKQNK